jgi:hypothetical protein
MSRYSARIVVAALLVGSAVALAAAPASAQSATFNVSPTSGIAGAALAVSSVTPCLLPAGMTGAPFARVTLTQGSTVLLSGDFTADASGAWGGTMSGPWQGQAVVGPAIVAAECIASLQAEGSLLAYQDVAFTVLASEPSAPPATFQATPTSGPTGTVISLTGAGCMGDMDIFGVTGHGVIQVTLTQGPTVLVTETLHSASPFSGDWTGSLTLPTQAVPGPANIAALCDPNATPPSPYQYPNVVFTVSAAPISSPISGVTSPHTGMPWAGSRPFEAGVVILGLFLIAIGGFRWRRIRWAHR